jgi:formate hydrogenlyase subunit 3/multisubunit Na+/H+ antiporter MnhD subunit
MKKTLFFVCTALLIAINCFSQSVEKTNYLQKSKNQKTGAFVLLGVGAALDIAGIITTTSNASKEFDHIYSGESSVNHGSEVALYIAGTVCLAGSLTLFILSKSNKKKAMSLSIEPEQFRQLRKTSFYTLNYPALTMKIRL